MPSEGAARLLPWNATPTWLAAAAALVFFGLGLRALLDPAGASAFFGVPVEGGAGLAFVRVYGARNVGISLIALALVALDMRLGLAALLFAAALIAGLDFTVVASHSGALRGAKHLAYLVALTFAGWWFASRG
ncbi:MAG: DUF4267 domain-containing protein [Alphaproteobacteria bacterium]